MVEWQQKRHINIWVLKNRLDIEFRRNYMGTSVINTFDKMLNESSDILKSIRGEVFGQLALGNYEQFTGSKTWYRGSQP